ncbi:MAG TPA: type II toxin-antitoxin system ParD family antitoxin [Beijerinckiaceae bacterium]|nr:type II toxin-antitoxin system ParD family antitoxin [Beijerinckiaceae bacterium]
MRKTVTVDLGEMQDSFEARLRSGVYASADELMQEALRALEREEQGPDFDDEYVRRKVEEGLADPTPPAPAEEVYDRLERQYREDLKAMRRGS